MELQHIRSFVEIARTGNLTQAAGRLNISQPALSAQIKLLEEQWGGALFVRGAKGMSLSALGEMCLPKAEKLLQDVSTLYASVHSFDSAAKRSLRLGLNTDGALLGIADLMAAMEGETEGVKLHAIQTRSEDIVSDLTTGKIQAGFHYGGLEHRDIITIAVKTVPMTAVIPSVWYDIDEGEDLAAYSHRPWIWATTGCPFYLKSIDMMRERGIAPPTVFHVDDERLIASLVAKEVGCSILAQPIAQTFAESGALKLIALPNFEIDLNFSFLRSQHDDPEIAAVLRALGLQRGSL